VATFDRIAEVNIPGRKAKNNGTCTRSMFNIAEQAPIFTSLYLQNGHELYSFVAIFENAGVDKKIPAPPET
jgi:hypothetical protein